MDLMDFTKKNRIQRDKSGHCLLKEKPKSFRSPLKRFKNKQNNMNPREFSCVVHLVESSGRHKFSQPPKKNKVSPMTLTFTFTKLTPSYPQWPLSLDLGLLDPLRLELLDPLRFAPLDPLDSATSCAAASLGMSKGSREGARPQRVVAFTR